MSDELTREHAMAEIIEALQAKVTALERERDAIQRKHDELGAILIAGKVKTQQIQREIIHPEIATLAARVRVLETELQTARAAVVTMEKVCKAAKAVDLTWDVDVTKPLPPYMDCIDIEPLMELRTAVDDYQRERRRPQ